MKYIFLLILIFIISQKCLADKDSTMLSGVEFKRHMEFYNNPEVTVLTNCDDSDKVTWYSIYSMKSQHINYNMCDMRNLTVLSINSVDSDSLSIRELFNVLSEHCSPKKIIIDNSDIDTISANLFLFRDLKSIELGLIDAVSFSSDKTTLHLEKVKIYTHNYGLHGKESSWFEKIYPDYDTYHEIVPHGVFSKKMFNKLFDTPAQRLIGIPANLGNIQRIDTLSLSRFYNFNPEDFKKLNNVRILEIYDCDLTEVPECIQGMSSLEELRIHSDRILHIPGFLADIPKLKKVDIFSMKLKTVATRTKTKFKDKLGLYGYPVKIIEE